MKNLKFFEEFEPSDFSTFPTEEIQEGHEGHEMSNYMFFQNLHTLKNVVDELLELDRTKVDEILSDGHGWALDHIATSVDDIDEVYHFLSNSIEMDQTSPSMETPDEDEDEDEDGDEDEDEDEDEDDGEEEVETFSVSTEPEGEE